jgi:hypothetical protein
METPAAMEMLLSLAGRTRLLIPEFEYRTPTTNATNTEKVA